MNGNNICNRCADNFYLHNGYCNDTCPPGTFENVNECTQCAQGCSDCESLEECNECDVGFQLPAGETLCQPCDDELASCLECGEGLCTKCYD